MVTENRNRTAQPPEGGARIDLYYGASIHPNNFAITVDPLELMHPDMGGDLGFDPEQEPARALEKFLYTETVQARTFKSHVMHPTGGKIRKITAVWKSEGTHLVGTATVEYPPTIEIEDYQELLRRGARKALQLLEEQGLVGLLQGLRDLLSKSASGGDR